MPMIMMIVVIAPVTRASLIEPELIFNGRGLPMKHLPRFWWSFKNIEKIGLCQGKK
jgi:hypothetical protein